MGFMKLRYSLSLLNVEVIMFLYTYDIQPDFTQSCGSKRPQKMHRFQL